MLYDSGRRAAQKLELVPGKAVHLSFPDTVGPARRLVISGVVSTGGPEEGQLIAAKAELEVPYGAAVARVSGDLDSVERVAVAVRRPGLEAEPIHRVARSDARLPSRVEGLTNGLTLCILAICLLCAATQLGTLAWRDGSLEASSR